VYGELESLAAGCLAGERAGLTLDSVALVSECFVRIRRGVVEGDWPNRRAFYALATKKMRQILVDHARGRLAQRRDRGRERPMSTTLLGVVGAVDDSTLLRLDQHFEVLERQDPRLEEIARLHYFAGLGTEKIAELHGISQRTVQRGLEKANGFLRHAFLES